MNKKLINEKIQVFVRCRPLLKSELHRSVPVEVHPELNRILVRDTGTDKCTVKSFTFDKVFGSEATQADIYNEIVAPVVQEVVQGFNCTIFAYGQTGTGKTFTIEGGRSESFDSRSDDPLAGIIPRSMNHLFNELSRENMKYEICVSFLELYNEEIFDLLSKCPVPAKLKMYENSYEKGSVVVQGLQIIPVKSMEEVYIILDKGCKKRRKAATLLNQASSRSHTIFTVTVSIKESSSTLEKVKSGKLNLVDLAGSENIGRSGASNKRAREAGNINQSLLALGRVITSLCEEAGHIPYRESKLTRLLRDSLGGQTKTAVIATISPSAVHIDETLNTLEYALRAKSITNKPELNAQVTVNSLMQDYLDKIYRLKKEMYEIGRTKGCLYTTDEKLINWKSSFESKRDEQFKILTQVEKLNEEEKSLDAAILEAKTTATAKQSLLEDKKMRLEMNRAKLTKEKTECKLREVMFELMQPIYESLHDEFHKDREETQALQAKFSKRKEALKTAANEQKNMRAKFEGVRSKRRQWNEKFHQNSENLKRNVTDMHENVHALTSECDNCISQLRKEFEARSSFYEKELGNVLKTASDFEAIHGNFQERINTLLHEEKSTTSKAIEDFQDAYSALSETSPLEPFNKALSDCQSSLLLISSSLNGWKMDLTSEVNARQRRLKEHVDSQKKTLETIAENAKTLLNKQKECAETFNDVVSECLNLEATNKKVMNDKFLAVEQALLALDIHCTQSIDAEVEKTNEANSAFKNFLVFGSEVTEELTNYCENSVNNIDGLKKEVIYAQSYSSEKFEDVKRKVNSSCCNYKVLNSELAKFHNMSQNFNGDCSDIECLLKNKLKACDRPEVSNQMQMMSDSVLRCGDSFKTVLRENQVEVEVSLLKNKEHLKQLTESSKQLSDIATSNISDSIQSLEENLVKSVTNQDFEMNSTESDENSLEISSCCMEKTVISSDSSCSVEFLPENECPACVNKTADETLKADYSTSVQISKESFLSTMKLPQAKIETSGSNSFMSLPKSPIRRPRGKSAMLAQKKLQYPDIEKLMQEILEIDSGL